MADAHAVTGHGKLCSRRSAHNVRCVSFCLRERHTAAYHARLVILARQHGSISRPAPGTGYVYYLPATRVLMSHRLSIKLHFKDHKGNLIKTIEANEGDDILSLAHEWDIDLEGESHHHTLSPFN